MKNLQHLLILTATKRCATTLCKLGKTLCPSLLCINHYIPHKNHVRWFYCWKNKEKIIKDISDNAWEGNDSRCCREASYTCLVGHSIFGHSFVGKTIHWRISCTSIHQTVRITIPLLTEQQETALVSSSCHLLLFPPSTWFLPSAPVRRLVQHISPVWFLCFQVKLVIGQFISTYPCVNITTFLFLLDFLYPWLPRKSMSQLLSYQTK